MFPAAAVAGVHAARRRHAESALTGLLRDPGPVWTSSHDMMQPVWLMFVYIHNVNLVPKFANTRFQIRVRYGDSGSYAEKYSQKVRSSTPAGDGQAEALFEAMFVFPLNNELTQQLNLDLVKLGFIDWTISTAGFRLPFGERNPGALEHDVLFFGKKGEDGFIGQLNLFMEVRAISRAELELGIDAVPLSALDLAFAAPRGPPIGEQGMPVGISMAGPRGMMAAPMAPPMGMPMGAAVGSSPIVVGHAMPTGTPIGGADVVQGSAVNAGMPPPMQAPGVQEQTFRGADGQVHHVIITRRADGSEERLEFTE